MAFLDNSGDIILDAVLTDTGRLRLARGDGSFKISKFAFGDDEIDYSSFNGNHASGSAYFDLEILQTPVFEAFTNNTANMKSKLISLTNNNLLYLPVLVLNGLNTNFQAPPVGGAAYAYASGSHTVVVDKNTRANILAGIDDSDLPAGMIDGTVAAAGSYIRLDQGLDTNEIDPGLMLDPELVETQYIIEMDSRFGKIYDQRGDNGQALPSYIDDDLVASYYFTSGIGSYVEKANPGNNDISQGDIDNAAAGSYEIIKGPRGTHISFGLLSSADLVTSNYLFDTIGNTLTGEGTGGVVTYKYIDSTIRVIGVTTGYKVDVPIRFIKA